MQKVQTVLKACTRSGSDKHNFLSLSLRENQSGGHPWMPGVWLACPLLARRLGASWPPQVEWRHRLAVQGWERRLVWLGQKKPGWVRWVVGGVWQVVQGLWTWLYETGFPGGASGKEPACRCRRHQRCGFNPWVGKILWRRKWQPILVFLLENTMDRGFWWATVYRVAKSQT